jgi:hypothetical protein
MENSGLSRKIQRYKGKPTLLFNSPALELPQLTMVDYKYYIQSALTQGYIESDVAKDGSKVKVDDDAQVHFCIYWISSACELN